LDSASPRHRELGTSAYEKATVIFEMVLNQHANRGNNIFGDGIWCDANAKFESCWQGNGPRYRNDLFYHDYLQRINFLENR
jgi:hypothetical protein